MNAIIQKPNRYLPYTLQTRYYAIKTYRNDNYVAFVTSKEIFIYPFKG